MITMIARLQQMVEDPSLRLLPSLPVLPPGDKWTEPPERGAPHSEVHRVLKQRGDNTELEAVMPKGDINYFVAKSIDGNRGTEREGGREGEIPSFNEIFIDMEMEL